MAHPLVKSVKPERRIAGLGFRAGAGTGSLRAALDAALSAGLMQPGDLAALATPADKADAPAVLALAAGLGLPLVAVPLGLLAGQRAARPSAAVPARYGERSVAESAALAAGGPGAQLAVGRRVAGDGMATAAIATCFTDPLAAPLTTTVTIAENTGP